MHEILGTAKELLEYYEVNHAGKFGPIDVTDLLGAVNHKGIKGKAQLWSMNAVCPAVALLDFEVLEDYSTNFSLENFLSIEIILQGNSEVQLGARCLRNSGMPRIYVTSHGPDSIKKRIHKAGEKYRTIGIWVSPRLFLETFGVDVNSLPVDSQSVLNNPDSGIITLPVTATVSQIANDIFKMPYEGMRAEQYLQAKFTELLCLIAELASASAVAVTEDNALPRNKSATLVKLMQALEHSHFLSLTLGEIACELGICKTTLSSVFKEGYGMKLSDYFLQRRMELARKLLQEGKLSALEVALEVGYNNQSSFGRAYRRYYNCTPSQHRH
jgi:AraC-like DNA-binding protein